MSVTSYYAVEGELLCEATDGVFLDYLTDALGSVTGVFDQTTATVHRYRYKPFGANLVGPSAKMGWVGSLGYRSSTTKYAESYVQRRTYGNKQGQWTSVDPLWHE